MTKEAVFSVPECYHEEVAVSGGERLGDDWRRVDEGGVPSAAEDVADG